MKRPGLKLGAEIRVSILLPCGLTVMVVFDRLVKVVAAVVRRCVLSARQRRLFRAGVRCDSMCNVCFRVPALICLQLGMLTSCVLQHCLTLAPLTRADFVQWCGLRCRWLLWLTWLMQLMMRVNSLFRGQQCARQGIILMLGNLR